MKIAISAVERLDDGLNSIVRGEGRWAINYAVMLVKANHNVFLCGTLNKPAFEEKGVKIVSEASLSQYEPFDLYLDTADFPIYAKAKKYIHLRWESIAFSAFEFNKINENHIAAYPYPFMPLKPNCGNKAFSLPTYFGDNYEEPKFDESKASITCRNLAPNIELVEKILRYIDAKQIEIFLNHKELIDNYGSLGFKCLRKDIDVVCGLQFNKLHERMRKYKIHIPLFGPSQSIDATFLGIPAVMFSAFNANYNCWFEREASENDVLIRNTDDENIIFQKFDRLLNDKNVYVKYLDALRNTLSCHLYDNAIKYFELMISEIF